MISRRWKSILLFESVADWVVSRLVGQGHIVVLTAETEALRWQLVNVGLGVLLRRAVGLQLAWNSVHWQVVVH